MCTLHFPHPTPSLLEIPPCLEKTDSAHWSNAQNEIQFRISWRVRRCTVETALGHETGARLVLLMEKPKWDSPTRVYPIFGTMYLSLVQVQKRTFMRQKQLRGGHTVGQADTLYSTNVKYVPIHNICISYALGDSGQSKASTWWHRRACSTFEFLGCFHFLAFSNWT